MPGTVPASKPYRAGLGEALYGRRGVALQDGLCGLAEEFFHDYAIAPHPINFAMAPIDPDHAKSVCNV